MNIAKSFEAHMASIHDGSWSVGRTATASVRCYSVFLHIGPACVNGSGKTLGEAIESAIAARNIEFPDKEAVARKALADAREQLTRAEAFASDAGIAA